MIEAFLLFLVGTLVMLAIIAANGYFVAQEFAYMSVDRTRLAAQAAEGDAAAKRALKVTRRTSFMLSGAQLGITVTGLLVGFVAEPLVGESLGVLLGGIGIPTAVGVATGTILALVAATLIQMIFGELYPKNLAIANPEPLARGLARSTLIYLTVFGWLIGFFDKAANLLLRALRIEPVHDLDVTASADDLPHIIGDSRDSGDLPVELSLMMDRIVDFPQQDVEHAMVPRSQVDWVSPDTPLEEVRALMARAHTRYPVIDDDDAPVGVV
ncbi:hemolysin family protein, partial [Paracoccus benzoatiresistens]